MLLQENYVKFLNNLVELLDITTTQFEKAKEHYLAVGNWLGKEDSPLYRYNPTVYPQGSFRLGTVIKPLSGEDEFDIDLVCRLEISINLITQRELKKMIGDRLKENADYKKMLSDEGKRCWSLNYQEVPRFHMDILPAIDDEYQWLINEKVLLEYAQSAICITDKDSIDFSIMSKEWHKSNPIGFANWFKDKMKIQMQERRKFLAESKNVNIEQISEDEIKTPLQRVVQILKRHRDIMFGDDEDKPISIIITTLAAQAYNNEDNLYISLRNMINRMPTFILTNSKGQKEVLNPVNPLENFADKWEKNPQKAKNFEMWLKKAKEDLIDIIERNGLDNSVENLREVFGSSIVNKALNNSGFGYLLKNTLPMIPNLQELLNVSHRKYPTWQMQLLKKVEIVGRFKDYNGWHTIIHSTVILKGSYLQFIAITDVPKPFEVFWQVVNTGQEAINAGGLRGGIFHSQTAGTGGLIQKEFTSYKGNHWIKCFIVKDNLCFAQSKEFFVRIE